MTEKIQTRNICNDVAGDADIRVALKEGILSKYVNDPNSIVVDEFNVSLGTVRADLAVVNGTLHAYEIKSDRDSLKRINNQVGGYFQFFEYVTVVSGSKYFEKLQDMLPLNCGLIKADLVNGNLKLKQIRKPKINRNIDKLCLVKALWRPEIIDILVKFNYEKSFRSKPKALLYNILIESFSTKQLLGIVKETIKLRKDWRVDERPPQCGDC